MKQPRSERALNEQARNEAGEWFVAFCENEVDGDRQAAFDEWLRSSPLHVGAYLRISAIWQNADLLESRLPAIHPAPPHFLARHKWRIAACLILALVAAGGAWWQFGQQRSYATEAAQRRTIVLPDGSSVELNARSKIKLEFSGAERGVALNEGQALFSVVKDSRRTFVVRVGQSRIAAVGTRFDVYRKLDEASITVIEGQVAVGATAPLAENQVAPPLMVSAGEQARLGAQLPLAARKVDVAAATSWTRGVLTFDSTPLEQAVEEYNRTGTRRLNIEDPNLLKVHISGIFPADDPGNMIKFLQRRFAVVVEETPEAIRLSSATHN
jgi:transmembrane sensor